jgi:2-amino-4-hydroxy-6-hydroxymethyldihydropteridine diphosphokinase
MLKSLKAMERDFGRRPGKRWGERVLDLDLVAWDGKPFSSRRLTIPHRHLEERDFVLGPLEAIAPGWRIRNGLSVRHLASRLGKRRPSR